MADGGGPNIFDTHIPKPHRETVRVMRNEWDVRVVGNVFEKALERGADEPAIAEFTKKLKQAVLDTFAGELANGAEPKGIYINRQIAHSIEQARIAVNRLIYNTQGLGDDAKTKINQRITKAFLETDDAAKTLGKGWNR